MHGADEQWLRLKHLGQFVHFKPMSIIHVAIVPDRTTGRLPVVHRSDAQPVRSADPRRLAAW